VLLGRDDECDRIERLLKRARGGRSGAILLLGEAGIGKSALVEYAAGRAAGMTVTRALGVESEAELSFGGLLELSRPLLGRLAQLPDRQQAVLRSAIELGAGEPAGKFAVGAATLSLVAAAAEDRPVLVLVDDAQWIDRSSLDALLFALRRLEADPVAAVIAARDDVGGALRLSGADVLTLKGLDDESAGRLLADTVEAKAAPAVVRRLHAATGGNPLALIELPSLLTSEQLAGAAPLDEPLPVGATIERVYEARAATLPDGSHKALLVVAASASSDLEHVAAAIEILGLEPSSLEPAEDASLVRIDDGKVVFRHPLVRSALFQRAPPSERRAAHRALAEALAGRNREQERAWHLAAAQLGPDEEAAAAIAAVAASASSHGNPAAAAAAFERSARLTSDTRLRALRLTKAATAALDSGSPRRTAALAEEAAMLTDDAAVRAQALFARGRAAAVAGSTELSGRLFAEAAREAAETDPSTAAESLCFAAMTAIHAGEPLRAVDTALQARELAPADGTSIDSQANRIVGESMTFAGLAEGRRFLEQSLETRADLGSRFYAPHVAAVALTLLDRVAEAHDLAKEAVRLARENGPGAVVRVLEPLAWSDLRAGRWGEARLAAEEGRTLAMDVGSSALAALMSTILAQISAAQGKEDETRTRAQEALALAAEEHMRLVEQWAQYALGLLEFSQGRTDVAREVLSSVAARMAEMHLFYRDVSPEPDLVELHARGGEGDEARKWLEAWIQRAGASGSPWAVALEARCHGIVAPDEAFADHFRRALGQHASAEDAFAEARTRLCFGERLRRAGLRVESREQLRPALERFEQLGAEPWSERARAELRASGATLRRREPHEQEELTPQELQIALQVAEGKTNKEVGAALFLSPKTIEFHLKRVYRKLGISSRGQLIRRFALLG